MSFFYQNLLYSWYFHLTWLHPVTSIFGFSLSLSLSANNKSLISVPFNIQAFISLYYKSLLICLPDSNPLQKKFTLYWVSSDIHYRHSINILLLYLKCNIYLLITHWVGAEKYTSEQEKHSLTGGREGMGTRRRDAHRTSTLGKVCHFFQLRKCIQYFLELVSCPQMIHLWLLSNRSLSTQNCLEIHVYPVLFDFLEFF